MPQANSGLLDPHTIRRQREPAIGTRWQYLLLVARESDWLAIADHDLGGDVQQGPDVLDWQDISLDATMQTAIGAEAAPVNALTVTLEEAAARWLADATPSGARCWLYRYSALRPNFSPLSGTPATTELPLLLPLTDDGEPTAATLVFTGYIRDFRGGNSRWELEIDDMTSRDQAPLLPRCDRATYPLAPASSIGQPIPRPYGIVDFYRPLPVQGAFISHLNTDINETATTIPAACEHLNIPGVTSASAAIDWDSRTIDSSTSLADWPACGYVLIDEEVIFYPERTASQLRDCYRGCFATTPRDHASSVTITPLAALRIEDEVLLATSCDAVKMEITVLARGLHVSTSPASHFANTIVQQLDPPLRFALSDEQITAVNDVAVLDSAGDLTPVNRSSLVGTFTQLEVTELPALSHPLLSSAEQRLFCYRGSVLAGPTNATPEDDEDGDLTTNFPHSVVNSPAGVGSLTVTYARAVDERPYGSIRRVKLGIRYQADAGLEISVQFGTGPLVSLEPRLDDANMPVEVTRIIDLNELMAREKWSWTDLHEDITLRISGGSLPNGGYVVDVAGVWLDIEHASDPDAEVVTRVSGVFTNRVGSPPIAMTITNPADIIAHLLRVRFGLSMIDESSFEAARAIFDDLDQRIRWSNVLRDDGSLYDVLSSLLWQCNSILLLEQGQFRLLPLHAGASQPVAIAKTSLITDTISIERTPYEDLANVITIDYDLDRLADDTPRAQTSTLDTPRYFEQRSRADLGLITAGGTGLTATAITEDQDAANLRDLLRERRLERRKWQIRFEMAADAAYPARGQRFTLAPPHFPVTNGWEWNERTWLCTGVSLLGTDRARITGVLS